MLVPGLQDVYRSLLRGFSLAWPGGMVCHEGSGKVRGVVRDYSPLPVVYQILF